MQPRSADRRKTWRASDPWDEGKGTLNRRRRRGTVQYRVSIGTSMNARRRDPVFSRRAFYLETIRTCTKEALGVKTTRCVCRTWIELKYIAERLPKEKSSDRWWEKVYIQRRLVRGTSSTHRRPISPDLGASMLYLCHRCPFLSPIFFSHLLQSAHRDFLLTLKTKLKSSCKNVLTVSIECQIFLENWEFKFGNIKIGCSWVTCT